MADNKDWTPAEIGGYRNGAGWMFDRSLTKAEIQRVECYVMDQWATLGGCLPSLPPDHPFYSRRPDPLDHLAPDHPWRKGTVPRPAE